MSTSGKYLLASVNGVAIRGVTEWSVDPAPDDLDATTADDNGYGRTHVGVKQCRMTIRILHNPANGAMQAIGPDTTLTNVRAFGDRNQAGAPDYFMPEAIVLNEPRSARVRGQIEVTVEIRSQGVYQRDGVNA